jgi:hypothetical protein
VMDLVTNQSENFVAGIHVDRFVVGGSWWLVVGGSWWLVVRG